MLTPTLTLSLQKPLSANQSAIWPTSETSETSAAGKSRLYAKRALYTQSHYYLHHFILLLTNAVWLLKITQSQL